jgi:hypothetical protein
MNTEEPLDCSEGNLLEFNVSSDYEIFDQKYKIQTENYKFREPPPTNPTK